MSYSITVQADTKQECLDMLATLLRASVGASQPVVQVTPEEKQALLEVLPASEAVAANMIAAEEALAEVPAPAPAVPALSPAEMRVRLRTLLTPHMKTDAANDVRALLKKHGPGGLSEVPDENLAALMTEALEVLQ